VKDSATHCSGRF